MDIKRFYVKSEDINDNICKITGNEFYHLTKVLRHKVGFVIIVCNNIDGKDYYAKLTEINKDFALAEIYDAIDNECKTNVDITLYQALPKGDKIDLITQKAVELGISNIKIFNSKYVSESKFNIDRLDRINLEACKQCGRSRVANINGVLDFSSMLLELDSYDKVLVCYENEKYNNFKTALDNFNGKSLALIIGSEGGFDIEEIEKIREHGGISVTLGSRILRAETASIVSVALAMYELGELNR